MKKNLLIAIAWVLVSLVPIFSSADTVSFSSHDGVQVTADTYIEHSRSAPLIVLFHQAGWSRGEYREIAPRLNALGFNCLAVDLRSGGSVNGVQNQTYVMATENGLTTTYVDTLPDMVAALEYARERLADGPVIAWGSSYSAALVLKIAGDQSGLVDGVLAFSPGEYFASLGKPADWIRQSAKKIQVPTFITSAGSEKSAWFKIFEIIPIEASSFLPASAGNHGSRALWGKFSDHDEYWKAVSLFLAEHFSP